MSSQVDDVKRALVAADVRALADRTRIPESIVMAIAERNGWDVAAAERTIRCAMLDTVAAIQREADDSMFAGGSRGGKVFASGHHELTYATYSRVRELYTAELKQRAGVVVTCPS